MTITINPHPQIICDTLAERDALPPREGIRVFCRETELNYIFDSTWKSVAGPGGPGGPVAWVDITGKPVSFPPETHVHTALEITGTAVVNNDPRLSDPRTPLTHTHPYEPENVNIQDHIASPHAPSNAQANADITKAEIEAKLIGEISSHTHAGGSGQPIGFVILANDTLAQALATNINTRITVTAARTLTTTVPAAGVRCSVMVLTSGTTSYTITFGAGFKPAGTLATGTTTNRVFIVNFISNGTNLYETGRTAAMAA